MQVDSGAWIGPTVLYGSEFASRVIAVEPDPFAYEILSTNVALNPMLADKVRLHRLGLARKPMTLEFKGAGGSESTSLLGFSAAVDALPSFPARCVPLAWLLQAHGVQPGKFALWKLDSEGAEPDIFPDSIPTLREYGWPVVHLSLHAPNWNDDPVKRLALLVAMRHYSHVYDAGGFARLELNEAHISGFSTYILSQQPLHFDAA